MKNTPESAALNIINEALLFAKEKGFKPMFGGGKTISSGGTQKISYFFQGFGDIEIKKEDITVKLG